MKIILRNHKKDNFVTNIKQNYASALVLSFLWNLGNSNTVRFGQCVICLTVCLTVWLWVRVQLQSCNMFDVIEFKKFFEKKNSGGKVQKQMKK